MGLMFLLGLGMVTGASAEVFSVDKGVIVHLFEWRYSDIARECEEFLGPYGFKGVQISPPSENAIVNQPPRPWWERYQPISYRLMSRSGDRKELEDMVDRCNEVGVRVFADVVLNHMTGAGGYAVGVGGSTATPDAYSYPAVPYEWGDFHQPACDVNNYNNATEVRVCQIKHLRDLNNTVENVRLKQVEFLDTLVDLGVAGFRVQAAKHIYPEDLKNIYGRVKNLNTAKGFATNTRPMIYQEVNDLGGEAVKYQEYAPLGLVTDFRYGKELGRSFQGHSDLVHLKRFGSAWNLLPDETGVVFVENHDSQRRTDPVFLSYKKPPPYKMALAFMLAFPYGTPKMLSSFFFDSYDQGPPHDNDYNILSPNPNKDNVCSNGWVCEHRWRQIYNMVRFHNTVKGTKVEQWWDNGRNQISFCRGDKGFIAFNTEISTALDRQLQTCLPQGRYCNVISGNLVDKSCTGRTVEVGADGMAQITIRPYNKKDPNGENDNVIALHVKAAAFTERPKSVVTTYINAGSPADDLMTMGDYKVEVRANNIFDKPSMSDNGDVKLDSSSDKSLVAENSDVKPDGSGDKSMVAANSDVKPDSSGEKSLDAGNLDVKPDSSGEKSLYAGNLDVKPDSSRDKSLDAGNSDAKPDSSEVKSLDAENLDVKPDSSGDKSLDAGNSDTKTDSSGDKSLDAGNSDVKPDSSGDKSLDTGNSDVKPDSSIDKSLDAGNSDVKPDSSGDKSLDAGNSDVKPDSSGDKSLDAGNSDVKPDSSGDKYFDAGYSYVKPDSSIDKSLAAGNSNLKRDNSGINSVHLGVPLVASKSPVMKTIKMESDSARKDFVGTENRNMLKEVGRVSLLQKLLHALGIS